MVTSAAIYHILHAINFTIEIRNVCVFLAPLFSSLTTLVTYHLTKELKVIKRVWLKWCNLHGVDIKDTHVQYLSNFVEIRFVKIFSTLFSRMLVLV